MGQFRRRLIMASFGEKEEPVILPCGYTKYDWIQGDGTAYIDSGLRYYTEMGVDADIKMTIDGQTDRSKPIVGAPYHANSYMAIAGGAIFPRRIQNNYGSDQGSPILQITSADVNTKVKVISQMKPGAQSLVIKRGNTILCSGTDTDTMGGAYVSVIRVAHNPNFKVYRAKIYPDYDMQTLAWDGIPCTDPNGVPGMYDLVSETFFANAASSGVLTVGFDVDYLTAVYDVQDISSATTLIQSGLWTISSMTIDGNPVSPTSTYQFSTTGEHVVIYDLGSYTSVYQTFLQGTDIKRLFIPQKITSLGASVCKDCTKLIMVDGLDHITNIEREAFRGCSNLVMDVNLPMLNQSQFIQIFYGAGITQVLSLGAITELGNSYDEGGAFSYCPNLTAVTLPSTLTTLNQVQFQYSPNFHTLTIPASVTTIRGYWSVIGRSQITELICLGETPPTVSSTSFTSAAGLQSIKVPAASVSDYQNAAGWSNYASIISAI